MAATAVPRSLCGCSEIATYGRFFTCRPKYSIWSAYVFGVERSTVAGRLRMISRPSPGCQTSMTSLQTSMAKSVGVCVKISGLYW